MPICANPKCAREFTAWDSRQLCCSRSCNSAYQNAKIKLAVREYDQKRFQKSRECIRCGELFDALRGSGHCPRCTSERQSENLMRRSAMPWNDPFQRPDFVMPGGNQRLPDPHTGF